MPPAAETKFVRAETSPTMTSSSGESSPKDSKDYYKAGSAEIVTETKLTVSRLEAVSGMNTHSQPQFRRALCL